MTALLPYSVPFVGLVIDPAESRVVRGLQHFKAQFVSFASLPGLSWVDTLRRSVFFTS
jgi:hypothetical protein